MNIAALVSGGVDSSVVVHLLKEQGYNPDIFYIRIGMEDEEGYIDCPAEEDIEITTYIAKKYGCRFEEVNLHKEYYHTLEGDETYEQLEMAQNVWRMDYISAYSFDKDSEIKSYLNYAYSEYEEVDGLYLEFYGNWNAFH